MNPKYVRETDLFGPINDFLSAQGYSVRAEVKNCDVTAQRGDELIIVEIKRRFSLDLLYQAADRQSITESVYVALPGPVDMSRRSRWRKMIRIFRRLELGLMAVTISQGAARVEILCHPLPYQRQKYSKRKRALLEEINARSDNYNQGGSVRTKIISAYRENAIFIACCLEKNGPLSPKMLREIGTGPKTLSILSSNFYKWFQRIDRGVYKITNKGKHDLKDYPDLVAKYQKKTNQL